MYKTWFMGTLDSVTCTSAIFAYGGKLGAVTFLSRLDGGVFGSGVLRRVWCVTRTACLLRILTRTAQAVSERARQSTSQRRRRRASRAPVTVEDAVGGTGSHRSAFAQSGRAGRRWSCTTRLTGHLVMDHSITGLIDCPSSRHAPTRADRPTSRPTSVPREAWARSGPLARRPLGAGRGIERKWTAQNTQRHVDHLARSPDRPPHSVGSRASTLCRRGTSTLGTARSVHRESQRESAALLLHSPAATQSRAGRAGRAPPLGPRSPQPQ